MDSEKISGIEMFRIAWHLMQLNESMKCLNKSDSQIKIFKETGSLRFRWLQRIPTIKNDSGRLRWLQRIPTIPTIQDDSGWSWTIPTILDDSERFCTTTTIPMTPDDSERFQTIPNDSSRASNSISLELESELILPKPERNCGYDPENLSLVET